MANSSISLPGKLYLPVSREDILSRDGAKLYKVLTGIAKRVAESHDQIRNALKHLAIDETEGVNLPEGGDLTFTSLAGDNAICEFLGSNGVGIHAFEDFGSDSFYLRPIVSNTMNWNIGDANHVFANLNISVKNATITGNLNVVGNFSGIPDRTISANAPTGTPEDGAEWVVIGS